MIDNCDDNNEENKKEEIIIFSNYNLNRENMLLKEMIKYQRDIKFIPEDKRIQYSDLKRIIKFIPNSIFSNTCCLWQGYITNNHSKKKGKYVNFYFRNKKKALHRLLYINFKDNLTDDEYIKYTCDNKGACVSVNCMRKIKYNKNNKDDNDDDNIDNDEKYDINHENLPEIFINKNISFDIIF